MADSDLRLAEQPKQEALKYFIKPELFSTLTYLRSCLTLKDQSRNCSSGFFQSQLASKQSQRAHQTFSKQKASQPRLRKIRAFWGLNLSGVTSQLERSMNFCVTSSGPEKVQVPIYLLFKSTGRSSSSFKPLMRHPALVVGRLWPKNLIN